MPSYAPKFWLESPDKVALARFQDVQRSQETFRDQFVERILDTEDKVLPQFKSADGSNADRNQQRPITRERPHQATTWLNASTRRGMSHMLA